MPPAKVKEILYPKEGRAERIAELEQKGALPTLGAPPQVSSRREGAYLFFSFLFLPYLDPLHLLPATL